MRTLKAGLRRNILFLLFFALMPVGYLTVEAKTAQVPEFLKECRLDLDLLKENGATINITSGEVGEINRKKIYFQECRWKKSFDVDGEEDFFCAPSFSIGLFAEQENHSISLKWQSSIGNEHCNKRTDRPKIFRNSIGNWVRYPVRYDGNSGQQTDSHILVSSDSTRWTEIESKAWEASLAKSISPLTLWDGIYFSPRDFTFSTETWKESDAHCCPSGPTLKGELEVIGNKIQLKSFRKKKQVVTRP